MARLFFSMISLWALLSSPALCQLEWGEGLPICDYIFNQKFPQITADSEGIFVVWVDHRSGTTITDIYAQRLLPDGTFCWAENGIMVAPSNFTQSMAIAVEGNIVAWSENITLYENDLKAQKLSLTGSPLWGASGIYISDEIRNQINLDAVSDGQGGAYFTFVDWSYTPLNSDISACHINSLGNSVWGGAVPVCTYWGNQNSPQIVTSNSSVFIVWQDARSDTAKIYAQKLNANGAPAFSTNGIKLIFAIGQQNEPAISPTLDGGIYITLEDERNGYNDRSVILQKLNTNGVIAWDSAGLAVSNSIYPQDNPQVVTDEQGNAIVAWFEYSGIVPQIMAQKVSPTGQLLWSAGGTLAAELDYEQWGFELHPFNDGSAVILYSKGMQIEHDIYLQRITGEGILQFGTAGLGLPAFPADQIQPSGAVGGDYFYAVWEDYRDVGWNVYGQKVAFDSNLTLLYPEGGEILQAGSADTIRWVISYVIDHFRLLYSLNAGMNYNIIADDITEMEYDWELPDTFSRDMLVKVEAYDDENNLITSDESDTTFTIGNLISGELTGTLSSENSPFIALSTIEVPLGDSLIIEEGVRILIVDDSLLVYGKIIAQGSRFNPIVFGPFYEDWGGVFFQPSASNQSLLHYCRFDQAVTGCKIDASAPTIKMCLFAQPHIWGINIINNSSAKVQNCTIVDCDERGLGIFNSSAVEARNNIIFNSGDYGLFVINSNPNLGYNDIFGSGIANYYNIAPAQGDFSLNPLFFDENYSLSLNSPCINSGDPRYPLDPDGSQCDRGWLYFNHNQVPEAVEEVFISLNADTIYLNWTPVNLDTCGQPIIIDFYNIYSDSLPYFTPSPINWIDQTADTLWNQIMPNQAHAFYLITAEKSDTIWRIER